MLSSKKIPNRILGGLCLFLLLSACSDTASTSAPEKDEVARNAIEERLIGELSPTDDREGQQRNAIINRAIDQNYDVQAAPEGYFYEVIDPGATVGFTEGDYVEAHYQGRFLNGKVFDNSKSRGEKLAFRIGELIPAWNLGILRIKNGGSIRILTPSNLAYDEGGLVSPRGDTLVPAHEVLEFLIEDVQSVEPPDGF